MKKWHQFWDWSMKFWEVNSRWTVEDIYIYIYIFCLTHPETKQQHSWTSPLYPWPINPKILSTLRGLWSEAGLHGWEEVRKGKTNGKDNFSGCSLNIWGRQQSFGYESIPIHTIFRGMNIHLPAILMFTRGTRFWHTAIWLSIFR